MKQFLPVLLLFLIFIGLDAKAQHAGGYTTVRVFDCNKAIGQGVGFVSAKILVNFENGQSDETELLPFSEKNEPENQKKVNQVLNGLYQKGYRLISSSTAGEQGSIITDYVFEKMP